MADEKQEQSTLHETFRQRQLLDVYVDPNGEYIDHIYREPSNMMLLTNPPTPKPDRVYKERYVGSIDGKVELRETIDGQHTPGFFTSETFSFDR